MTSITNNSDNNLVIGTTLIPRGTSVDVPDWDDHAKKDHIKQMLKAEAIGVGKGEKLDAPADERTAVTAELDRFKVDYDKRLGTDKLKGILADFKAKNPEAQ